MKVSEMKKFLEPFPASDIDWRLQSCGEKNGKFWGKALAYITSRAVQERLDEVCGPDGWKTEIKKDGDAYLCILSIRVEHEDGTIEWLSRTDGADSTDIEAVKGGISGAIKRAAVQFGIGRYLYNLKESWANISDDGIYSGKTKEGKWFRWDPPKLPDWALPDGNKSSAPSKPTEVISEGDVTSMINICLDYISAGIIEGENADKTSVYIKEKNGVKLREVINWCKQQEKKGA